MFFKKKNTQKTTKQNNNLKQNDFIKNNDITQEKRLFEFKENIKKLSKNENSAIILAKQLSRLIQKSK
ncbi:hypothetical protein [Campylobacter peloridis]|uniref:Molybdenum cofactor biosynthesis protein n=1 Tax=Campylobacter peloridis TaxID=488546 RepID=A0A5C7DP92_9BACT|nr:hypothetical protein [Campylobacter peloridis]AJC84627.1 hypothetical protein CPEL_0803 [Campylobacter peloridis LMG 23910]MBX1886658.1 molybdenum cofactor biosynthesis protein [Campylobacter peloridis]MBX2079440.1 molybdenum cofactor biosynthesis protein [Campylobacter peloridis]QOQ88695.1 molybdenum cofactor biosynthesis protein [Campylobacter peloridis]TXE81628.1 molybdenum cofactor biosynthesis protein [Campylobacter peloridis]